MRPIKDAFAAALCQTKNTYGALRARLLQERGNSCTKLAEEQKNLVELESALRDDIREMELRITIGLGALLKVCPACGHEFKGKGWQGIDAHWRSKHEDVMPYEKVWPYLKDWKFPGS